MVKNLAGNIDFTPIFNQIWEAKETLKNYKRSGAIKDNFINEQKREYIENIKRSKDKLYNDKIAELESKLEGIKSEHENKQEESDQELLRLKRIENKIKAAKNEELEEMAAEYSKTGAGDLDELTQLAAELRGRNKAKEADTLRTMLEAYNTEQPWKNDRDYKATQKEIQNTRVELANGDLLILENGNAKNVNELLDE